MIWLFDALSRALRSRQVSNTGRRQLCGYLRFYRSYPQIVRTASALLPGLLAP
ncbi:MAG: cytoplasmic protein, partial [Ideonella sp.]|nr:cytoplasmic protein [Ideonella sp.]